MTVIRTPNEDIEWYFNSDRLSQSRLKLLLKGMREFLNYQEESEKDLYYKEKHHFIIGSGVDCLLTQGQEEFDKQYYVSTVSKPSEKIMSITKRVFDEVEGPNMLEFSHPSYRNYISMACDDEDYQSNWKEDTRINKIIEGGELYFNDLVASRGKQVLSIEEDLLIKNIVRSFKESPRTSFLFDEQQSDDVDVYFQYPIYFRLKGVDCKALIDILIVFKNSEGEIVRVIPVDIKTMSGETFNFPWSMKSRRYDIQSSWYVEAISQHFNIDKSIIGEDKNIKFLFAVESSTNPGSPLIFRANNDIIKIGKEGRPEVTLIQTDLFCDSCSKDVKIVREVRGYESLLDDYLFYQKTGWQEERIVAENDGKIDLIWD